MVSEHLSPKAGGVLVLANAMASHRSGCSPLRYIKYKVAKADQFRIWATRLFRCPSTGHRVQAWFADNGFVNDDETYRRARARRLACVTCLACRQVHMVSPKTGKVLDADEETN